MDADIKKHILSLLATGHPHDEMSKMLECTYCGKKFQKAKDEFERLKKLYPDKFGYEIPQTPESIKMQNMRQLMEDRIKKDSEYRKHLDILARGTAEEKRKEWRKEDYFSKKGI